MKTLDRASPLNVAETDPHGAALLLFNEHGGAIYRFCRGTLRNETDAEDVVQETFLKLLQHLRSEGDRRNLKSWLFTVAANACRDRLRWRVRWLPWNADRDERTVGPVEHSPDLERARDALRSLAARDRLLLSLRANGLSSSAKNPSTLTMTILGRRSNFRMICSGKRYDSANGKPMRPFGSLK